ncbi:MAG TPA: hypothetical protein VJS37_11680, partial [Terriglobales bacterium]|nr:hypothetical protein [Terriglobales bacterium]
IIEQKAVRLPLAALQRVLPALQRVEIVRAVHLRPRPTSRRYQLWFGRQSQGTRGFRQAILQSAY